MKIKDERTHWSGNFALLRFPIFFLYKFSPWSTHVRHSSRDPPGRIFFRQERRKIEIRIIPVLTALLSGAARLSSGGFVNVWCATSNGEFCFLSSPGGGFFFRSQSEVFLADRNRVWKIRKQFASDTKKVHIWNGTVNVQIRFLLHGRVCMEVGSCIASRPLALNRHAVRLGWVRSNVVPGRW